MTTEKMIRLVYGTAVTVSAFLLFAVEPIIAKYILPWFGGSPSVWTTCLLFFMVILLCGYIYAHILQKHSFKRQVGIHAALVCIVAFFEIILFLYWQSPVTPSIFWRPAGADNPVYAVLTLLIASIGLPYFLLASTSSLLQAWYSKITEANPYRLYTLSNIGSLVALLLYPFLIEPNSDIYLQGKVWGACFILNSLLLALCAWLFYRNAREGKTLPEKTEGEAKTTYRENLKWLTAAAFASFMLVSVTPKITQGIASVPFLWIVPLVVYLLSYILSFRSTIRVHIRFYGVLLLLTSFMTIMLSHSNAIIDKKTTIAVFLSLLFLTCFMLNRFLYETRPVKSGLTRFYLLMSLGGALGGFVGSILAPLVLKDYFELPFALVICVWVGYRAIRTGIEKIAGLTFSRILEASLLFFSLLLVTYITVTESTGLIDRNRNFYGVIAVLEKPLKESGGVLRLLQNGIIIHGNEVVGAKVVEPTSYYSSGSGIDLAFNAARRQTGGVVSVGIIGLGAGGIAAYCEPRDSFRYYEINPAVISVAEKDFTYLSRCRDRAHLDIVEGDARLSLESEISRKESPFDILVLDAFSDDAVPVHLLTKEALGVYFSRLKDKGILAVHISNLYLDLLPVLKALGSDAHLENAVISHTPEKNTDRNYPSLWVLFSKNFSVLNTPAIAKSATKLSAAKDIRLWTDSYSTLFPILK